MKRSLHALGVGDDAIPATEPRTEVRRREGRAFRSTWIVSSLESVRGSVHWPRYLVALTDHRDEVLSCVAGVWCPMAVARAHYGACDALDLSRAEVMELFDGHGHRIRQAWYAPFIALARGAASPWEVLARLEAMWLRSCDGGAVVVSRAGDCHAHIEYVGCELFDIPYFRESVRTVLFALVGHSCAKRAVEVLPQPAPGHASFSLRWGWTGD